MKYQKVCESVPLTVLVIFALNHLDRPTYAGFSHNAQGKQRKGLKGDQTTKPSHPAFQQDDTRVVAVAGSDVTLPCRVTNLNDQLVSWIRSRDLHILTSGAVTFTADDRFQMRHSSDPTDWSLNLKKANKGDSGLYECQVNTDPKMSRLLTLDVVSVSDFKSSQKGSPGLPAELDLSMADDEGVAPHKGETLTRVLGKKEQYVKTGSTITFTCLVISPHETVPYIDWLRNGRQVSFQASRGGIIVDTEKADMKATSRLTLADVRPGDSGNYTCKPGNAKSHSVTLIVLDEERTQAMKRQNNSGQVSKAQGKFVFFFLCQVLRVML